MVTIDDVLAEARAGLQRVTPEQAYLRLRSGALLVDIRPQAQRDQTGEIPGSTVIEQRPRMAPGPGE